MPVISVAGTRVLLAMSPPGLRVAVDMETPAAARGVTSPKRTDGDEPACRGAGAGRSSRHGLSPWVHAVRGRGAAAEPQGRPRLLREGTGPAPDRAGQAAGVHPGAGPARRRDLRRSRRGRQ